jgi:acetylornithine deacetylase/succinyl-diaminopimelate desuccinylase-like protein
MIGDESWIVAALAELVSTPSLSGREAAVQQVVRRLMIEAGADGVRVVPVDAARLESRYGFRTPTPTAGMFSLVG